MGNRKLSNDHMDLRCMRIAICYAKRREIKRNCVEYVEQRMFKQRPCNKIYCHQRFFFFFFFFRFHVVKKKSVMLLVRDYSIEDMIGSFECHTVSQKSKLFRQSLVNQSNY